jgi:hypothetical protein
MMGVIDKERFEQRSAGGCSNSDYEVRRTECCGSYCVEDTELSDLYLDASDLSRRVSLLVTNDSPIPCPFCGSLNWGLLAVESEQVPIAWKWACVEK